MNEKNTFKEYWEIVEYFLVLLLFFAALFLGMYAVGWYLFYSPFPIIFKYVGSYLSLSALVIVIWWYLGYLDRKDASC